jgi:hypothetical protein
MATRREPTCNDCYFRRAGLCALALEAPCPTFRTVRRGAIVPPRQPRLIPLGSELREGLAATP